MGIPFRGSRQAPRLLLVPLVTGSHLIASFLLRKVALVVKLGWTAAMNLDATPAKGQESAPGDDGAAAAGPVMSTTRSGKKATKAAAGDEIERLGVGCLIILAAVAALAGIGWLFMWLAWPYIAPFAPVGAAVLTVLWVIAAWMIAPPLQESTTRNDHEKSAGEQGKESDQDRVARGLARFIVVAVRDAAAEHKGVHIAELLERLQTEQRGFDTWDQPKLRAWCTAAGIPVSKNVRAKGKGPTWGVRVDELQEAFGTSLDEALETLARPVTPASSRAPAATPHPAVEISPAAPLTTSPAEGPVPAGDSAPAQPHLQAGPDPSPEAAA
ncbi:hypothetical protein [Streptomyces sp. NPDC056304]|uniref:hypothetical protein n=1 Tax=Streptomyces sp. NPDC056304 TaxID=3345778 RepID=UPI0035DD1D97